MKAWVAMVGIAGAALAVSGWSAARAAAPPAGGQQVAREYRAEVALDIDAHGQVTAVQLPADLPPVLAGPAREAIGHWRFEPPVRGGHAVTARTWARVRLQLLRQSDGNYGLRAVYGSNGPGLTFARRPDYPRNEIRQRGQGRLVMEATVQPDGTLTDVQMASYRFNHPDPGAFRTSAETVMRYAHAQPELVDGKPVATRIQVPFVWALQSITRGEALSRQVSKETTPGIDSGSRPIGEVVALDSPVRLIRDPQG